MGADMGMGPPKVPGPTSPFGMGGVSQGGTPQQNLPGMEMPLTPPPDQLPSGTATANSDKDAERLAARQFTDKPWFAKLPPELRSAIRSNSERRPPRAYEEKLRRYFENKE
jgi:hypothetical protein